MLRLVWGVMACAAMVSAVSPVGAETPRSVEEVVVIGTPSRLNQIPGSGAIIDLTAPENLDLFSVNDALRKTPGVFPRGEEGLALRPNIGIRGLNPTRSSEVLLLEDGVPLSYAPYGDNASYYHPPLERFSRIEVLKGASQVAYGPHTVGGVINYVTPSAPQDLSGRIEVRAGNRSNAEVQAGIGDTVGDTGYWLGGSYRQSDGSRDNHALAYGDLFTKVSHRINGDHVLTFKANWRREDSQVSYSGLTLDEFEADPRQNPFTHDRFDTDRTAASVTHSWALGSGLKLLTTAYGAKFERDWWRQASNSGQRPSDSSDIACGSMANIDTTCGTEGRLRSYIMYGLESRLKATADWGAARHNLEFGARLHREEQDRLQINADTPDGRTPGVSTNAGVIESNLREADAFSLHAIDHIDIGAWSIAPGVRYERMTFTRTNRLTDAVGEETVEAVIPGVGISWRANDALTVFAGAHKGFSPPRVEDVVSNSGGTVDLDAEESLNTEFGLRARLDNGLSVEAAVFRMDFANQIVPASVAGGVGSTLTSAGETLHQGIEFGASTDDRALGDSGWMWSAATSLTYLPTAKYVGERFSNISGFSDTSVTGNRLPYAPEWLARFGLGLVAPFGLRLTADITHTGEMFTDDLNTMDVTANGQRGLIDSVWLLDLGASYTVPNTPVRLSLQVKNATDELFVVDRSRGILPGEPRIVMFGVESKF